jgi:hypothetical protein
LLLSHDAFENVHEFFDLGVVLVLGKGSWVRLHLANEEGMKKKNINIRMVTTSLVKGPMV